jgi:hypothetical protein
MNLPNDRLDPIEERSIGDAHRFGVERVKRRLDRQRRRVLPKPLARRTPAGSDRQAVGAQLLAHDVAQQMCRAALLQAGVLSVETRTLGERDDDGEREVHGDAYAGLPASRGSIVALSAPRSTPFFSSRTISS